MDPSLIKTESNTADCEQSICGACLRTHCRLFSTRRLNVEQFFTEVIGIPMGLLDKFPQGLCVECATLLTKYKKFLAATRSAHSILANILKSDGLITSQAVQKLVLSFGTLSIKKYQSDHYDLCINDSSLNSELSSEHTDINDCSPKSRTFEATVVKSEIDFKDDQTDIEATEEMKGDNQPINQLISKLAVEASNNTDSENVTVEDADRKVGNADVTKKVRKKHCIRKSIKKVRNRRVKSIKGLVANKDSVLQNNQKLNEKSNDSVSIPKLKADGNCNKLETETMNEQSSNVELLGQSHNKNNQSDEKKLSKLYGKKLVMKRTKKVELSLHDCFTVKELSVEQQKADLEKRKKGKNYLNCVLKCEFCYKGFAEDRTYKLHMAIHSEESGSFACDVCKYRKETVEKLREHIITAHLHSYLCKQCDYQTKVRSAAFAHASKHSGKGFQCKICSKEYDMLATYLSHQRLRHPAHAARACALCASAFFSEHGLALHVKIKHKMDYRAIPANGPACADCGAQFVSEDVLEKHRWTSHKDPSNSSSVRRARGPTKNQAGASQHCPECGKLVRSGTAFYSHLRKYHPNCGALVEMETKRPHLCDVCGKTFQYQVYLRLHQLTHANPLGIPCEECGRMYKTAHSLEQHRLCAHRGKLFPCEHCAKTFSNPSNALRHRKNVHEAEQKVQCQYCDKKFKYEELRQSHEQHVHLNKPWPKRNRDGRSERKRRKSMPKTVDDDGDSSD